MPHLQVASFNLFGIHGRSVQESVTDALNELGSGNEEVLAIGFQEVWKRHQLQDIRRTFLGANSVCDRRGTVDAWSSPAPGPWRCLVPRVRPVMVPLLELELSSGLALCVRGRLKDRFFQRYRGAGAFPDNVSNKGILAALVVHQQRSYAVVNTHLHDSKNDAFGGARGHQIEQLANALGWIEKNWLNASIILLGDFNVDSIEALARTNPVTTTLYAKLLLAARGQRTGWHDANAGVNRPPVHTTAGDNERMALDHHLLSPDDARVLISFDTRDHGSDHLMTKSRWQT